MRVFSTLMSWSNENKSELTSESLYESFSILMSWSNENKSCMRVFSIVMSGQTKSEKQKC